MAHSINKMMSQHNIETWGLDFEDIGLPSKLVTDENKNEYQAKKVFWELIDKRRRQLNAMKKGFQSIHELNTQLRIFAYNELMILCCGREYIDAEDVIKLIV